MFFLLVIGAVLAAQIAWHRHNIKRDFSARGLRVYTIRWRPFERFFDGRITRNHMLYRVQYADESGGTRSCLVVWKIFEGFTIEERRSEAAGARATIPAMSVPKVPWMSAAGSALACIAIGIPYWALPYRGTELPRDLVGPGLVLLGVFAGALQYFEPRRWFTTLALLSLAPVGTAVVRIVTDLASDPTSHNLFPFEIAIAGFVGVVTVAIGMSVGGVLRRFLAPSAPSRG